jgi:hypothetical protein
VVYGVED